MWISKITTVEHTSGAPLFRKFGVGPKLLPVKAIHQLKELLKRNSFWAFNREIKDLKKMIKKSSCIITIWENKQLIAFGRATSDWRYRAVLWDVIVDKKYQKKGIGKLLINKLLECKAIQDVEKVYLMTTNCKEFYKQSGFQEIENQSVLLKYNNKL